MKVMTISGSSGHHSSNALLLDALPALFPQQSIYRYKALDHLPLFRASIDHHPWPAEVIQWRKAVAESDAIVISTPEYIHNLPALLKNALEWISTSGELAQKRVLAMTFLPTAPRGEKAMQSLLWSLKALDARVVAQLPLFRDEILFDDNGRLLDSDGLALLRAGLNELGIK